MDRISFWPTSIWLESNLNQENNVKINQAVLSKIFIWTGVSVWGVYGLFLLLGKNPSLLVFLPIHLTFVLTGVRLRKGREGSKKGERNPNLKTLSNVFLAIGVAAWLPYFYVHYFYQIEVGHLPFLVLHLTGMLSGGLIKLF